MKWIFLFTGLSLYGCASNKNISESQSTKCIGPKEAKNKFIYLHGMDSNPPSLQEFNNISILEKIAEQKSIRIAIPRATSLCPNQTSLYCWGWNFDQNELRKVIPIILNSEKDCFSNQENIGLIGFSNGGYFLTRIYPHLNSLLPNLKLTQIITSGSTKETISSTDLSTNPPITIIIGTQDQYNYDPTETLFHQLQNSKASVKLIKFDGGHILDFNSLLKAL